MKSVILRVCSLLVLLAAAAFGQTPVYSAIPASWEVKPGAVPASTTTVVSVDAYLTTVTVSNPTGAAIVFSVCDKQGTPVCAIPAASIPANTAYVITWPAYYWCPGGFTVLAGSVGLTFSAGWRQ